MIVFHEDAKTRPYLHDDAVVPLIVMSDCSDHHHKFTCPQQHGSPAPHHTHIICFSTPVRLLSTPRHTSYLFWQVRATVTLPIRVDLFPSAAEKLLLVLCHFVCYYLFLYLRNDLLHS